MLRSLSIRDIVVFDRLDLDLAAGLSALTGETGAGKSILLDALGLATGQRAEGRLVRQGQDKGSVIAEFDPDAISIVRSLLDEQEIDADGELIVRRTLSADGRSRAFVNDQPVSVGFLAQLGGALVEVHGQAAETGLMQTANHRGMLDRFAGNDALLDDVQAAHRGWRAASDALHTAEAALEAARREEDFIRHAAAELSDLAPEPGEEETLASRRGFLMQASRIAEAVDDAVQALEGDGGIASRLRSAERALDRVRAQAEGRLEEALGAIERAAVELDEAVAAVQTAGGELDIAPGELDRVDERLFALRAMARKHRVEPDALPALAEDMAMRLASIDRGGADIARLKQAETDARATYVTAAEALRLSRQDAASRLDQAVQGQLEPLRMGGARFVTRVESLDETGWTEQGADRVGFEVATNPGATPGPIARIASGGELSRFMLALKVVLAETGDTPVLVFDEVDRGVGGATADAVGERLQGLASRFQVLVVTHSPQVAARAGRQWLIEKKQGNMATTSVTRLDGDGRLEEIARMLSGAEVTAEARAAANRLLESQS